jgi:hypothetical protein
LEPVVCAAAKATRQRSIELRENVERQFQFSHAGEAYRVFCADCKAKLANSRSKYFFAS